MRLRLLLALLCSLGLPFLLEGKTARFDLAQAEAPSVPASNRAELEQAPPRPSAESAQEQAKLLFEAIVHDDPARAASFFFPRDAFVLVKAMQKPERYYDKLRARFDQDIHALHRSTPDLAQAEFERLELTRRGGWVKPGDEGNRLPYWAARHAWLHYRVGVEAGGSAREQNVEAGGSAREQDKAKRKLEVRVLITWDDRWYVIHLSEFR